MSLAKYQVRSLVSEVKSELKSRAEEVKDKDEFIENYEEIASGLLETINYSDLQELHERKEQLSSELDDVKSEIRTLNENARNVVKGSITIRKYSDLDTVERAVNDHATKVAENELGIPNASTNEIFDAIVVADLSEADDIISAVIEKLT